MRRWVVRHRRALSLFALLAIAAAAGLLVVRAFSPSRRAALLAERARILIANGQLAPAVELYSEAHAIAPAEPRHAVERASLLGRLGRWDEAEAVARDATTRHPDDPASTAVLGWILHSRGRSGEAVRVLLPVIERLVAHPDPAFACQGLTTLGRALASVGRLAEAERHLRRASSLRSVFGVPPAQPQREEAVLVLAEVLRLQRRAGEAEAMLREGLRQSPGSIPLLWALATHLVALDRLEEAIQLLERVVVDASNDLRLDAAWLEAEVLIRLGQVDRALTLGRALPEHQRAILDGAVHGAIALAEGRPEDARGRYARLAALLPTSSRPLLLEARAAVRAGALEDARRLLQRALELDPGNREAHRSLLELEERVGDLAAVRAHAETLLEDPVLRAFGLRALFGLQDRERDRAEGALARLTALRQQYPDDLSVRAYEAVLRILSGQQEEGVKDLLTIAGHDGLPAAFGLVASLREGTSDAVEAIELLAALTEREQAYGPARLVLAGVYTRLGRPDLAVREVESVLAREPANHDARLTRARLALITGDLTRACSEVEVLRAGEVPSVDLLPLVDALADSILSPLRDPRPDELSTAARLLELGIQLAPDRALAHARLARVRTLTGELAIALQGFTRALALDPALPAAHGGAALALAAGEHGRAAAELRRALEQTGDPRFGAPLGAALALTGDIPGARAALLPWMGTAGRCPEGELIQAILLALAGDPAPPPRALEHVPEEVLAAALALTQAGADVRRREVFELFGLWSLGLLTEARERSARIARDHPTDPLLLWWAQRPLLVGGAPQLRAAVAEKLEAVARGSPMPGLELAQARQALGDVAGEAAVLESLVRRFPDDPEVRTQLGRLHERAGRVEEAIAAYSRAVTSNRPPLMAENNLACLLAPDPARRTEALTLARRARDRAPERGETWDTLGWAMYLAGEVEPAEPVLGWAATLQPTRPTIRYHLARVLAAQQKVKRALNHLRIARLLGRRFPEEDQALALEKRLEKAIAEAPR